MINILKKILFLVITLTIFSCANTRVVVEGVKTVIKKDSEEEVKKNKNEDKFTKGHYKIGQPYVINNIKYTPKLVAYYDKNGIASWYGPKFDKKPTANGEIFDQNKVSAAHKTLPLPSIVKVTNLNNNKFLYIRVNDRGPFFNNRIIDLSKQAAIELNIFSKGTEEVNVRLLESGPHLLETVFLESELFRKICYEFRKKKNKEYANLKEFNFLQLGVFSIKENALVYIEDIKKIYEF